MTLLERASLIAAAMSVLIFPLPAGAEGDAKRGAEVYGICSACHSLQEGVHLSGPSLAGLWGRKAASAGGFVRYSDSLKAADVAWDENSLNAFLADPEAMMPGTYMSFRGIGEDAARADLIAFLRQALVPGGAEAVVKAGLITAELAAGQVPPPLGAVGPERQVSEIRHCGDSYFITNVAGEHQPFWETNVRLKIDSSRNGPAPGKPALVGSGMQGDRISIVFSSFAELSRFIVEKC